MKKSQTLIPGFLLLCMSASAHANPIFTQDVSAWAKPSCINLLENATSVIARFNPTARENILHNLSFYETLIKQARSNVIHEHSNEPVLNKMNASLERHADETVAGMPVGSLIVGCVRPYVAFKGSKIEQQQLMNLALTKISSIRKAIQ